ncbi:hypothetical protein V498_09085, partial [Pseudogymnoascus sp. VKM F-4517 (FW-2822)]
TSIDWAGVALERVTGLSLNAYLQKNVFEPLGIRNMSMIPSREMRDRLAHMHHRDKDGVLSPRDHLLRLPLVIDPDDAAEVEGLQQRRWGGVCQAPGIRSGPIRAPKQRHLPRHQRAVPARRNSRRNVPQPDRLPPQLQPKAHPGREAGADERDSGAVPSRGGSAAGVGAHVYAG